ncbi:MAG: hypothetical protein Q8M20_15325 [Rhodocyclaceae bacterium]|nr:hypothetical protein [Rhodocyclaceae bacterium]MDZ4215126.1 hypothetical protein [Rhodocyclaceae bacterium]
MKSLLSMICCILFSLPAAAGQLEGILPLAKDDVTAVAQVRATPEKHVLLYFGDHVN